MDIGVKKETVEISGKKAEVTINTSVENDIIIPDTKEDIKDVVNIDSYISITGKELQNERAVIYGTVYVNILYVTDEEKAGLRSISASMPFSDVSDIRGAEDGDVLTLNSKIRSSDYKILNGRKLNLKSQVETKAAVYGKTEKTAASGVDNIEGFEDITETVSVLNFNPTFSKEIKVEKRISLPMADEGAKEILRVHGHISDKNVKIINGKVIVKGETVLSCLYESKSGEIKTVSDTVGFTEIFDVSGIKDDVLTDISFEPSYLKFTPYDNDEEIRGTDVEMGLSCSINYYESKSVNIIKDCYCVNKKIKTSLESVEYSKTVMDVNKQIAVKDSIVIPENAPLINKIIDIDAKSYITSIENSDNKLIIKGCTDTYLLYMSEDENAPLYSAQKTIDFEEEFDKEKNGEYQAHINVNTLGSSYSFSAPDRAEVRCNVELKGVITGKENKDIISDIEFADFPEDDKKAPSFTVYFAKKGEKLWDIAKKYYTTVSAIKEMNEMESEKITEPIKLFIPSFRR